MQFRDLQKQYEVLKPQIDAAVQRVCAQADFISGHEVKELEQQLAGYVGTKHCITCANGTDALSLVLMAWGIGPDDAVLCRISPFLPAVKQWRSRARHRCL